MLETPPLGTSNHVNIPPLLAVAFRTTFVPIQPDAGTMAVMAGVVTTVARTGCLGVLVPLQLADSI